MSLRQVITIILYLIGFGSLFIYICTADLLVKIIGFIFLTLANLIFLISALYEWIRTKRN